LIRLIATCVPVDGSVCATGAVAATGCRTGLSIKLPAMVLPTIVTEAIVLIFMRTISFNLTALRCDADFGPALVVEP
jgi:hypothetical protein